MTLETRIGRRLTAIAVVIAFVAAVVAHATMVHAFGVEVPFGDQWGAEGLYLLKPWAEGHLGFSDLFIPWNEHRIVFSRIVSILIYEGSAKTWSVMRTMYFNTLIYACIPALLIYFVGRSDASRRQKAAMACVIVLFAILPYGWENTLGAFQNSFYFMILLAIGGTGMAASRVSVVPLNS